ncbi:hypothetical protein ACFL0T_08220, partial [Candidatus Omnitrophota bacterium]
FLVIELLPAAVIILVCRIKRYSIPALIWFCLLIMVILPLFEMGINNDLVMRGGLVVFLIIMIFCAYILQNIWRDKSLVARFAVILFFVMVMPVFVNEYIYGFCCKSYFFRRRPANVRQYIGYKIDKHGFF